MHPPHFPHQPYLSAFESWRARQGHIPEPVARAWTEVVGLVLVREVLLYGAHPDAEPFDRDYARSMAWEDLDMALRGGASGLLRHAMERLWMLIRSHETRASLGAALTEAAAVAYAEAERSGWRERYAVRDRVRPILTNPHAHGIAEVAQVYNGDGTRGRQRERLAQEPDVAALRGQLFGWRAGEPGSGPA